MRYVVVTDRGKFQRGDRMVQADDEVRMRVEQRAVEIEYDKGGFHEESAFAEKRLRLSELKDHAGNCNRSAGMPWREGAGDFYIMPLFWLSFGWRAV
jgi:hypothetical protein